MRECCRQVEAEVASKSRNKIHQTWGPPISGALYIHIHAGHVCYMAQGIIGCNNVTTEGGGGRLFGQASRGCWSDGWRLHVSEKRIVYPFIGEERWCLTYYVYNWRYIKLY